MFEDKSQFEVVKKLPFKFSFIFEGLDGKERKMMIEDWEVGALFWRSFRRHNGNEKLACEDVKKKYFEDFAKTKDLYFYLGTSQLHHFRGRNPFMIIGTFHPKIETQIKLDFY